MRDEHYIKHVKTKKCSVVLERLNEKLLKLCLLKYGLKLNISGSCNRPKDNTYGHPNRRKLLGECKKRLTKVSSKFIANHFFKRRKRSKPLCYTDSESSADENNSEKKNEVTEKCIWKSSKPEEVNCNQNNTKVTKNGNGAQMTLPKFEIQAVKVEVAERRPTNISEHPRTENQQVLIANDRRVGSIKVGQPVCNKCDIIDTAEDDDQREDNEDDRHTVIFEQELAKNAGVDKVVELLEKITGNEACKEFKNTEITNRKKQRLVKFTRKTMLVKNTANIKQKNKVVEDNNNNETLRVSEEVCILVKRLHEMRRIISQLQREWPNNAQLAVHFHRMLNTQKENFYKEIKRSRKIILKSLNIFGDARKMALEISKQIGSNSEDVASVISQCVQFENPLDVDKNHSFEKIISQVVSQSSNNLSRMIRENFARLLTVNHLPQKDASIYSSFNPSVNFNHHPEVFLVEDKISENHPAIPRRQKFWVNNNYVTVIPYPENGFRAGQIIQNGIPGTTIVRYPAPYKSLREQSSKATRCGFLLPVTIPGSSTHRVIQERPVFNVSVPCKVSIGSNSAQNTEFTETEMPTYVAAPVTNSNLSTAILNMTQNNFTPIKIIDRRMTNPQHHSIPDGQQCPFVTQSVNQNKYSNPKKLLEETCSKETYFRNESKCPSERLLDPTIPQKLTMKNHRLQAEPILQPQFEGTNPSRSLMEVKNYCLNREDSRVYVCAQNGCENPGVGICKSCQSVIYCSETCQLNHWNLKHKAECYQLKQLRG